MAETTFGFSIQDYIRKLSLMTPNNADFIANLATELQEKNPTTTININLSENEVSITSNATIPSSTFSTLEQEANGTFSTGIPKILPTIIPPTADYQTISIASNGNSVTLNGNRQIQTSRDTEYKNGTQISISRKGDGKGSEKERLEELFSESDLEIIINGKKLARKSGTEFDIDGFQGTIKYDTHKFGKFAFFKHGRKLSTKEFLPGFNVCFYNGDYQGTHTKSDIVLTDEIKTKLESVKSKILLHYIKSEDAKKSKTESPEKYQAALRTIIQAYAENQDIKDIAIKEIRFADTKGKIKTEYSLEYIAAHPEIELLKPEQALFESLTGQKRQSPIPRNRIFPKLIQYGIASTILVGAGLAYFLGMGINDTRTSLASQLTTKAIVQTAEKGKKNLEGIASEDWAVNSTIEQEELAQNIADLTNQGYIRHHTNNRLTKTFTWTEDPTSDRLSIDDEITQTIALPKELAAKQNYSRDKKLEAIADYMQQNFEYGLSPENTITGAIKSKKAICGVANTIAAIYAKQLGLINIRMASGTYRGSSHAWLEVLANGKWQGFDCTPPNIDPNLREEIKKQKRNNESNLNNGIEDYSVYDGNRWATPIPSNINLGNILTETTPRDIYESLKATPNSIIGLVKNPKSLIRLYQNTKESIPYNLLLSILGLAGLGTATELIRRRKKNKLEQKETDPNLVYLRDMLGVNRIDIRNTPTPEYDSRTNTLHISQGFNTGDVLNVARDLVPLFPAAKQTKLYQRIGTIGARKR